MSNGLSQAEIDALLSGGASESEPAAPSDDPNAMMTPEQIAALIGGEADSTAVAPPEDPNAIMTPEQIAALLDGTADSAPAVPPEDPSAIMTPEQIAALLDGTADSAPAAPPEDPNAIMTPEQIAALLDGADDSAPATSATPASSEEPVTLGGGREIPDYSGLLSDVEVDAMGEIGNISMGTGATTLFAMLNRRVDITTPRVIVTTMKDIADQYPLPFVGVEVSYTVGLEGTNVLFLRETDVKIITDLLLGGDGTNIDVELNEMHLSAICEVMNQMTGSSSTSLAKLLGTPIDITPPRAYTVDLGSELKSPFDNMEEIVVRTSFDLVVDGLINSEIMQITPIPFARRMVEGLLGGTMAEVQKTPAPPPQQPLAAPQPAPPPVAAQQPATAPQPAPSPMAAPLPVQQPLAAPQPAPGQETPWGYPPQGYPAAQPGYPPQYPAYPPPYGYGYPPPEAGGYQQPQMAQQPKPQPMVDVRSMHYESFDDGVHIDAGDNMDLLMDVPLQVSVELGKTRKYIKEVLDFNIGTIVVLDKMAGEMVDIVVNGKLIAKGEVVVIDDNYGARITDIVSPSKRLSPGK